MIEKCGDRYKLQCDYCSNYVDDFDEFSDAVTHKKANGWRSQKVGDDWFDKCPDCIGGEDY